MSASWDDYTVVEQMRVRQGTGSYYRGSWYPTLRRHLYTIEIVQWSGDKSARGRAFYVRAFAKVRDGVYNRIDLRHAGHSLASARDEAQKMAEALAGRMVGGKWVIELEHGHLADLDGCWRRHSGPWKWEDDICDMVGMVP